ncbi:MAG: hypothetical protein QOE70_6346 [Chthoniobacter sp.]|jgi:tetratricopeptide (TPR) repeat protein|nr:hypothetical protein [Chthoniobacter sp.]
MRATRCLFGFFLLYAGTLTLRAAPGGAVLVEKENVVETQIRGVPWQAANVGLELAVRDKLRTGEFSRAAVRFTDLSMLRVDELTTLEVSPPVAAGGKQILEVQKGGTYFFSRERPEEMEIRTPAANGALRGTEFALRVTGGKTTVAMFEGELELSNAHGRVLLRSGEQGEAVLGAAPRKTAMIEAVNIIQWCLYYPAVLDPALFAYKASEERGLADSLAAYRAGDLPGALARHPRRVSPTPGGRLYRAAVLLSVGQVDKARTALAGVPKGEPGRRALEQMIAAVKFQEWTRTGEPQTSSEWLAESYYQQSRSHLEAALRAARKATELSPEFGYAWARVAELEFSFGRIPKAMKVLERALELAPRNAQALALQGFLLSAENRMGAARRSFEQAIVLDGALGNAWLGRGLTAIRQNREDEGRRDLQTAAALEPNRSILRSYLGKAFSQVGENARAHRELDRTIELDPNDPTPWLYSAIQNKQENRYNAAVADLEKSVALNDNRRVYRSQFLLDQDRAVRGANLAAIYLNNGMTEQSVREAVRAVDDDYGSAPAHLFLADSFNALRDPTRILLRYETAWFNERLLANLLSPVGGGPLSQFVSEQEYSKMFERDGLGINVVTEYDSHGRLRHTGSQYGTFGNLSYALDAEYQYDNGIRPNNRLSRLESYGSFKLQLGPQDTVFLQTKFGDFESGDILQRYNPEEVSFLTVEVPDENGILKKRKVPNRAAQTFDFEEKQDPGLLLLGWHHEWAPGNHTLLLLGRLANEQVLTDAEITQTILFRDVSLLAAPGLDISVGDGIIPRDKALFASFQPLLGQGRILRTVGATFDLDYRADFETYSAELQQIITLGPSTTILGGRYQSGEFDTHVRLTNYANGTRPDDVPFFQNPPAKQDFSVDLERVNLYLYDILKLTPWLSLTGGVTYDSLQYPDNFRNPPINDRDASQDRVSPKAGLVLKPWQGATIRGSYSEAISGASFDESVRLEPTQVAGFLQAYRTLASESLIGSVAGSRYQLSGASFEQKLPTRTYFGIEYHLLEQKLDRTIGVFDLLEDFGVPLAVLPSSIEERDRYREDGITASLNQLFGECWSVGARYRYTRSRLQRQIAGLRKGADLTQDPGALGELTRTADTRIESGLHELSLFALFNHPSGFFARAEANWYRQENDDFVTSADFSGPDDDGLLHAHRRVDNLGLPGEDFWQLNLLAGWRFYRNQCELSGGVLNLADADYRLSALNPYLELPRDRTFVLRCKLAF